MTRHARRVALVAVFSLLALTGAALVVKGRDIHALGIAHLVAGFTTVAAVVACGVGVTLAPGKDSDEEPRPEVDPRWAHPYRPTSFSPPSPAPHVSARVTAALLLACMAFTALAVPFALHLPRWLEVEGVLGAWWLAWALILGVIAYRGQRLADHGSALWTSEEAARSATTEDPAVPSSRWWSNLGSFFDIGMICEELAYLLVVIAVVLLAVGAAVLAAWFVVELVAPALFCAASVGLTLALRQSRRSQHRGKLARAGLHGAMWASAYVAPLAALVAVVHVIAAR